MLAIYSLGGAMNKGKPVTIKEIAKRLKISPSTVSRALNDHPSIGLVTTIRVKKMAEELNYVPNQTAIFFKQRKTFTIGVIVPSLMEPFFSKAISEIEEIASKKKYTVLMGQSLDDEERERSIIQTFRKHRVDGVLISLGKNTQDLAAFEVLSDVSIPYVFFDCVPSGNDYNRVFCDLYSGMEEALIAFKDCGHTKIALINGPEQLLAAEERENGFKKGLKKLDLPFNEKYIVHTNLTEQGNVDAIEELLSLPERPSAIISFNDYVTLDVMSHARKRGVGINQDIHFISFANYPLWKYIENPPMGSIEQFPDKQAQKATEMLFELIDKKENQDQPQDFKLSSKLILH